jgi:enoyl-CoA hydratase/carnithine racemase
MTAAQRELVLYSRDEHVVTITLTRSEKRNAFNAELVKELRAALLRFEADDDAFVAVLTGSGPCFSSGADVGERQIRSVAEFDRLGGPQEPDAHTADLLARLPKSKPIVAAVHGVVMGLGIGVAFECDLVVADSQTRFQITETPRGLGGLGFAPFLRRRQLRDGSGAHRALFFRLRKRPRRGSSVLLLRPVRSSRQLQLSPARSQPIRL